MNNILLLEDEEILWKIYKKKLEMSWYKVVWVTTIESALNTIKTIIPEIIILDHWIRTEKQTWTDIIPIMRQNFPNSYIILLSNYSNFQLEKNALQAWADKYFLKVNVLPNALTNFIKNLKVN